MGLCVPIFLTHFVGQRKNMLQPMNQHIHPSNPTIRPSIPFKRRKQPNHDPNPSNLTRKNLCGQPVLKKETLSSQASHWPEAIAPATVKRCQETNCGRDNEP